MLPMRGDRCMQAISSRILLLLLLLLPMVLPWSSSLGKTSFSIASYFGLNAGKRLNEENNNKVLATGSPVSVSGTPISASNEVIREKKVKLNKYQEYSKATKRIAEVLDPIKETIKRIENEKENTIKKNIELSPSRGTTVPTIAGRISKSNNSSVVFEDFANIVPSDPFTFGYIKIGVILGSHGVKGEVKIQLETDFGDYRIQPGNILYIKRPNRRSPRPITILNGRLTTNSIYLVRFNGIEDRIAANVLRNYNIYGRNTDTPGLREDEYMIRDLVDLECFHYRDFSQPDALPIGVVAGVVTPDELCDTPSISKLMHSMLEVRKCSDSVTDSDELCLIPLVKEIVTNIDLKAKRIYLDPPEGLLELAYKEAKKYTLRGFLPASVNMDPLKRKLLEKTQIVWKK